MNENLNLGEILKDCPKGIKLYSPIYGDVEFMEVIQAVDEYPIQIRLNNNSTDEFTKEGRIFEDFDGECMLFPSKEQRDWSKFKAKKPKFDPKTLKPYDKVLVRNESKYGWECNLFSHIKPEIEGESEDYKYCTLCYGYIYCIPYNDDTKHLVGTTEEAPEFYRYWED